MTYKCEMTIVVHGDGEFHVISEERVADDPLLGLDLLWIQCKQQLSMRAKPLKPTTFEVQVLAFVDPILHPDDAAVRRRQQELLDKSKRIGTGSQPTVF